MLRRYVPETYKMEFDGHDSPVVTCKKEPTPCVFCTGESVVNECPEHGVIHRCGCVHLPPDREKPRGLVPVCACRVASVRASQNSRATR